MAQAKGEERTEVTEAMMEAGAEVIRAWDEPRFESPVDLSKIENNLGRVAKAVYLAMATVRKTSERRHGTVEGDDPATP